MKSVNKPRNGYRYGAYSLEVICDCATLPCDSGMYKIVIVKTDQNQRYSAIKQYNADGEFVR